MPSVVACPTADVIVSAEHGSRRGAIEAGADRAQLLAFAEAALQRSVCGRAEPTEPAPAATTLNPAAAALGGRVSGTAGT